MREVLFRSYVADALGRIAGVKTRWSEIAYPDTSPQPAAEPDHRSTREVADGIISGLSAILEGSDTG